MAFSRPTFPQLRARIYSDLVGGLGVASPVLPKAFLRVLADVLAAVVHALYGFAVWIRDQCFPDTAEAEYLDRWAALWGVERKDPGFATGAVTFTGSDDSIVPAGSVLIGASGVEYTTDADATITGGSITAVVTASASGVVGNLSAGAALSLSSPVPGINSAAMVAAGGLTGGADIESDDALRTRVQERMQHAPHGGDKKDYEFWAKEVPGVTRAWSFPYMFGLGTVGLTFAVDGAGVIPSPANVADVQAYIDTVRPITAEVTVFQPVQKVINFTISVDPDTAAVREAVQEELASMLATYGYPGNIIPLSQIIQTIAEAEGERANTLVSPAADIIMANNEIATLGVITWQ